VSRYMGTRRRRRRSAWDTILGVGKIFAGAVDVEVGEGQQVGGAEGHQDGQATARDARGSGGVREVGERCSTACQEECNLGRLRTRGREAAHRRMRPR
jgi:hypothetical protein